ncbi:MAG: hypothetical protein QOK06_890, partial [Acidimicrobiaceae bacterium]
GRVGVGGDQQRGLRERDVVLGLLDEDGEAGARVHGPTVATRS